MQNEINLTKYVVNKLYSTKYLYMVPLKTLYAFDLLMRLILLTALLWLGYFYQSEKAKEIDRKLDFVIGNTKTFGTIRHRKYANSELMTHMKYRILKKITYGHICGE